MAICDCTIDFVHMITKLSILNFLSVFVTITAAGCFALWDVSVYGQFATQFASILDSTTNIIFITLSQAHCSKHYEKACGCLHQRCTLWCFGVHVGGKNNVILSKMSSTSAASVGQPKKSKSTDSQTKSETKNESLQNQTNNWQNGSMFSL
eukprot:204140_1